MAKESGPSRTRWYVLAGVAVVLIGVVVGLCGHPGGQQHGQQGGGGGHHRSGRGSWRHLPVDRCAGPRGSRTRPPGPRRQDRQLPGRPAVGRPQPGRHRVRRARGGCHHPPARRLPVPECPLVGDLRSAREPDVGILSQLSDPLFVHAGGIDPVIALLASAPLIDDNLYTRGPGSAIIQEPGRVAPYATFVNTASLWAFNPTDNKPPAPIFHYSTGAASRIGRRFGGQRPHPLLLDLRRDLEVEPVRRLPAVLLRIA